MSIVAGVNYHFTDLPVYLRGLLQLNKMTPFVSMAGQMNGIRTVGDAKFDMAQPWSVDPGEQTGYTEAQVAAGQAPTRIERDLEQNGIQLFQRTADMTYLRQSIQNAATPQLAGKEVVNGESQIDALAFQLEGHSQKINKDWDFSSINGVLNIPTAETGAGQDFRMGGLIPAITANVVDGAGAALSKAMVSQLLANEMQVNTGSPFVNIFVLCNPIDREKLTELYKIADRDTFEFGGVRLNYLVTNQGDFPLMSDVHVPQGTIVFADMAFVMPTVLPFGGDGIYVEPVSKRGATSEWEMYFQASIDFGSELVHGKITNFI